MKTYYLHIVLLVAITSSCKKVADAVIPQGPPGESQVILVREKSSNMPISGAAVFLQECSDYDFVFGCMAYTTRTKLITNAAGQVTISGGAVVDRIEVQKDNYWVQFREGIGNVDLTPIVIAEVSIKQINTYTDTSFLKIGITPPDCIECPLGSVGLPKDTIIYLQGYGYSDNTVKWSIVPAPDTLSIVSFFIDGFDTARVFVEY